MTPTSVQIDDRFHGFPGLAIGGYTGGLLARRLGGQCAVSFRQPVPTGEPLQIAATDDAVELRLDDDVAAVATPFTVDIDVPDPVSLEQAAVASRAYLGHRVHPYPSCFTCGPDRAEGDGLRVFPGPVENRHLVAAAWTPHPDLAGADGNLPLEYVWAAVDCSSIWPLIDVAAPDDPDHVVTGRLAVRLDEPIRAGERHVVAAWPLPGETGRRPAAATIRDDAGAVKAVAHHTLVVADWGVPLGVAGWNGRR